MLRTVVVRRERRIMELALKIINVILVLEILFLFGALVRLNYKRNKMQKETQEWIQSVSQGKKEDTDKKNRKDGR